MLPTSACLHLAFFVTSPNPPDTSLHRTSGSVTTPAPFATAAMRVARGRESAGVSAAVRHESHQRELTGQCRPFLAARSAQSEVKPWVRELCVRIHATQHHPQPPDVDATPTPDTPRSVDLLAHSPSCALAHSMDPAPSNTHLSPHNSPLTQNTTNLALQQSCHTSHRMRHNPPSCPASLLSLICSLCSYHLTATPVLLRSLPFNLSYTSTLARGVSIACSSESLLLAANP